MSPKDKSEDSVGENEVRLSSRVMSEADQNSKLNPFPALLPPHIPSSPALNTFSFWKALVYFEGKSKNQPPLNTACAHCSAAKKEHTLIPHLQGVLHQLVISALFWGGFSGSDWNLRFSSSIHMNGK